MFAFVWEQQIYIAGKKVEIAHLWGKIWQLRHNNFKSPFKEMVSIHASRMLSLLYIFNGGRWGDELQYKIGQSVEQLRDPRNPNKIHPIMQRVIIPEPPITIPKIELKRLYKSNHLSSDDIVNIFYDNTKNELNQLLAMHFENQHQCNIDHICQSNNWSINVLLVLYFIKETLVST